MSSEPSVFSRIANRSYRIDVVYKCDYNIIKPDEIDAVFVKRVGELMKEVCGEAKPHKSPNFKECQYCPVTSEDCADQVDKEKVHEGETDEF